MRFVSGTAPLCDHAYHNVDFLRLQNDRLQVEYLKTREYYAHSNIMQSDHIQGSMLVKMLPWKPFGCLEYYTLFLHRWRLPESPFLAYSLLSIKDCVFHPIVSNLHRYVREYLASYSPRAARSSFVDHHKTVTRRLHYTGKPSETNKNKGAQRISNPVRKRLFSVKDASTFFGFSIRSVRNLVYARELPIVRLGAKTFLDIEDLEDWITKKKGFAWHGIIQRYKLFVIVFWSHTDIKYSGIIYNIWILTRRPGPITTNPFSTPFQNKRTHDSPHSQEWSMS